MRSQKRKKTQFLTSFMKITSHQIKGKGRGKFLGFPTINLEIPAGFELDEGIYSGIAIITASPKPRGYLAAIHFGPVPTFNEQEKSLEIFLIDAKDLPKSPIDNLTLEIKNRIREIKKFETEDLLKEQIEEDVENIRTAHVRESK